MKSAARLLKVPELTAPWQGYHGPSPAVVKFLHRHDDGFIAIASKKGGKYRDLCAIPASSLQLLLPLLAEELREDAYFSVHGLAVAGARTVTLAGIEALARAVRKSENADYLTSVFVDCDCYRAGLSSGTALGKLLDAERAGTLPPVSAYQLSGRGVWAFWLLGNEDGQVPKTGGTERRLWAGIEREIVSRVRELGVGVDEGAIDLARVCRLPGSINTSAGDGTGEDVRFLWQTDSSFRVPYYRLEELAEVLGVRSWIPRIITGGGNRSLGKIVGWRALWQGRLERLDALALLRGGYWQEGHRNRALFLLALCLRKTGHPDEIIRDSVEQAGIASGLPVGEAVAVVRKIERLDKYQKFSDEKMRDWLGVTPSEATEIGWSAPTVDWSAAKRAERSTSKAERIARRRELITEYVRTVADKSWSSRKLQAWLEAEHELHVSRWTIDADLEVLGIALPATKTDHGQGELAL